MEKNMRNDKEEKKYTKELQEEIEQLKKRIKDLERERDILLALHKREIE
jgi:archaellum component FlaC